MGSAEVQGRLWATGPRDWAQVCEPLMRPLYEATVRALAPLERLTLLDAGCGTGLALRLSAEAGARVTGLDATGPLLEVARERVPEADLRVGDVEDLPFDDGAFDVVTGFNVVQYAAGPQAAVAELARVVRPGGRVAIGVWADPARCQTDAVFAAVRALVPPAPGAAAPLAVSATGVVEGLLAGAGLTVTGVGEADCPFIYPDLDTGWRGQSAAGPFRQVIEVAGAERVREVFERAHEPHRLADGTYRQENVFRYVIATKAD